MEKVELKLLKMRRLLMNDKILKLLYLSIILNSCASESTKKVKIIKGSCFGEIKRESSYFRKQVDEVLSSNLKIEFKKRKLQKLDKINVILYLYKVRHCSLRKENENDSNYSTEMINYFEKVKISLFNIGIDTNQMFRPNVKDIDDWNIEVLEKILIDNAVNEELIRQ